jgi:uncharacterized RDD family membrane protein YckC
VVDRPEQERLAEAVPSAQYGGWRTRVGAYFLDSLLIALGAGVLLGVLYALVGDTGIVIGYLAWIFVPFAYFAYFHAGPSGQTPGKKATGIRVRRSNGSDLGFGRGLARYAFSFALGIFVVPILIDYLWPLWDERHQALHDKVVDSVVVRA